ncbi:hypothetical protein [Streptomyces specialis]|uniref:hypothetical protein n=1 Tax=Streptomyces specialis TaxID=498367 RepID=UPI00073F0983|nr:hypothetical protein [Streptomyces specialis]
MAEQGTAAGSIGVELDKEGRIILNAPELMERARGAVPEADARGLVINVNCVPFCGGGVPR